MNRDGAPGYPEPPAVGDEAGTLLGSLERQRASSRGSAPASTPPACGQPLRRLDDDVGGLLKHLAYMEDDNFTRDLARAELPSPWDEWTGGEPAGSGARPPTTRPRSSTPVGERGRPLPVRGRRGAAEAGWTPCTRGPDGQAPTLRRLLVDLIEEYARHTGHADLIRESVDGRVGEDPPGPAYPYRVT